MNFTTTQTSNSSQRLYLPPPLQESTHTWLPTLNLFMPHTWRENSDVNSSVAKNDDTATNVQLWDQRVLALWPCFSGVLNKLRSLTFRFLCRKLLREFIFYLRDTHGKVYDQYLKMKHQGVGSKRQR